MLTIINQKLELLWQLNPSSAPNLFCQRFCQRKKRISAQAGLQIQHKTREGYKQEVCHSVGNLTKWFYEVNVNRLYSYGMTKETLKINKKLCAPFALKNIIK